MPEQIENSMVVDSWWNEIEYGVPYSIRLRREREIHDQIEREEKKNG